MAGIRTTYCNQLQINWEGFTKLHCVNIRFISVFFVKTMRAREECRSKVKLIILPTKAYFWKYMPTVIVLARVILFVKSCNISKSFLKMLHTLTFHELNRPSRNLSFCTDFQCTLTGKFYEKPLMSFVNTIMGISKFTSLNIFPLMGICWGSITVKNYH